MHEEVAAHSGARHLVPRECSPGGHGAPVSDPTVLFERVIVVHVVGEDEVGEVVGRERLDRVEQLAQGAGVESVIGIEDLEVGAIRRMDSSHDGRAVTPVRLAHDVNDAGVALLVLPRDAFGLVRRAVIDEDDLDALAGFVPVEEDRVDGPAHVLR